MKKLNYLLLGLAGLTLASCSNDDLQAPADGTYQITVNLPADMATRAIGDNPTDQTLSYTLFQVNSDETTSVVEEKTGVSLTNNQATINLPLVKGYSYKITFFAQSSSSSQVYSYNTQTSEVTVAYDKMTYGTGVDADAYDCFSGNLSLNEVGGAISESVTLERPVAQINWGTTDLEATAVTSVFDDDLVTSLSLSAFTTLDILTGKLDGTTTVTFPATAVPTGQTYPISGYNYLAMQYVLAQNNGQSGTYDLTLTASKSDDTSVTPVEVKVNNAPLQANYRTNIYGALLTDQANITVSLGTWGGSYLDPQDYGEEIDGTGLYLNSANKTYAITSVSALQKMGAISQNQVLQNYTMVLTTDLDMKGQDFTPIKNTLGVFDGQGHTISNLTITGTENVGFMSQSNGTLQNLNFKDATVTGNKFVGVAVGYNNCGKINNVNVNGATVNCNPTNSGTAYDGGNKAGGIAGYLISGGATAYITNCSVTNVNVSAYREVGAIVGYAQVFENYPCYVNNCTATNSSVTANQQLPADCSYNGAPKPFYAGEISGYWDPGVTYSNNTATDVTVNETSSEGITTNYIPSAAAWQNLIKDKYTWSNNVILTGDLDFEGGEVVGTRFMGTFDGQGHTIKNATIIPKSSYATGFFAGDIGSGTLTVNNVTFQNMKADNSSSSYGWAAVVIGDVQTFNVVLNDVNVLNSQIHGMYCLGALAGFVSGGKSISINNCTVDGCKLSNTAVANESGFVCGMVGRVVGTANFGSGNSVSNTTIDAYWTAKRGEASIAAVAAPNATTTVITGLENVKVTNVNITRTEVK